MCNSALDNSIYFSEVYFLPMQFWRALLSLKSWDLSAPQICKAQEQACSNDSFTAHTTEMGLKYSVTSGKHRGNKRMAFQEKSIERNQADSTPSAPALATPWLCAVHRFWLSCQHSCPVSSPALSPLRVSHTLQLKSS